MDGWESMPAEIGTAHNRLVGIIGFKSIQQEGSASIEVTPAITRL